MERRVRGNPHARCGVGEKVEIISKPYLSLLLKYALACDCNAMVLAHNHPGGSKNFSTQDKELTQRMVDIFHPLDVKILDHIIVAGTGYSSMAEKGVVPYHNKDKANYEAIALDSTPAKEKRNRFQNTHLR